MKRTIKILLITIIVFVLTLFIGGTTDVMSLPMWVRLLMVTVVLLSALIYEGIKTW